MSRPLGELEARAFPALQLEGEVRKKLVRVAKEKSPSAAFGLAKVIAQNHGFAPVESESIARATRWLAVIRRDYGQKDFDRIVAE